MSTEVIEVTHDDGIKMTTPKIVRPNETGETKFDICLHVTMPYAGTIEVKFGDQIVYQNSRRCMPARRIRLKNIRLNTSAAGERPALHVSLKNQT